MLNKLKEARAYIENANNEEFAKTLADVVEKIVLSLDTSQDINVLKKRIDVLEHEVSALKKQLESLTKVEEKKRKKSNKER